MLTTTLLFSVPAAHKCDQEAETESCGAIWTFKSKNQATLDGLPQTYRRIKKMAHSRKTSSGYHLCSRTYMMLWRGHVATRYGLLDYLSIFSTLLQIIQTSDIKSNLDYKFAQKQYKMQFEYIFTPVKTESPALVKYWECVVFYNLLWSFNEDVLEMFSHEISSSIKWSSFAMHFVHPLYFSVVSR